VELIVQTYRRLEYGVGLRLQEELLRRKIAGDPRDYLMVLEHEPVYTLGRGADSADLQGADVRFGVPVHRVGRGGGATYHGPGQLVAYPVLTLRQGGRDVHRFVRALEDWLIDVCARFCIVAERREAMTGVWAAAGKIASIGIGVRRWTTFHGVALNVDPDLEFFRWIVPCRVPDMPITSMAQVLGAAPPLAQVQMALIDSFRARFGYENMVVRKAA
jgi:lipoate-protein ligase B